MRYRRMMVVALPALGALALLQPSAPAVSERQPSAAQIDAAMHLAQLEAGLPSSASPRRR
jgi:hypothetical protein